MRGSAAAIGLLLAVAGGAVHYIFETAGTTYALEGATFVGVAGLLGGVLTVVMAIGHRTRAFC